AHAQASLLQYYARPLAADFAEHHSWSDKREYWQFFNRSQMTDPQCGKADDAIRLTVQITSAPTTVRLPLKYDKSINGYTLYWDEDWNSGAAWRRKDPQYLDGAGNDNNAAHTYNAVGFYTIVVRGDLTSWHLFHDAEADANANNYPNLSPSSTEQQQVRTFKRALRHVWSLGKNAHKLLHNLFEDVDDNLWQIPSNASFAESTTNATDLSFMFGNAKVSDRVFHPTEFKVGNESASFTPGTLTESFQPLDPSHNFFANWNTAKATDFRGMFFQTAGVYAEVSKWNTGSARNFNYMWKRVQLLNPWGVVNWDVRIS
ncbi:unnamed protein product, partial [Amoebophrya sp. A120]